MAAKNTNLAGSDYFAKAAKMIPWSFNYNIVNGVPEKYISVPSDQWPEAMENLSVCHLVNQHGFVLQDCIPMPTKNIFDPILSNRVRTRSKEEIAEYPIGAKFKVGSTGTVLELTEVKKDTFIFNYAGVNKDPFTSNKKNVERMLGLGAWKRI